MIFVDSRVLVRPAARANGTVKPSDIPMTISRTTSLAVKWRSLCCICGILELLLHLCFCSVSVLAVSVSGLVGFYMRNRIEFKKYGMIALCAEVLYIGSIFG